MSATPREVLSDLAEDTRLSERETEELQSTLVAFDALLAVAKAADDDLIRDLAYDAPTNPALRATLAALDAANPDWRTWG